MKKLRSMISLLLACTMVLSGITVLPAQPVQAVETKAAGEYTIYPTPQSVVYGKGDAITLPAEVNAVFESGIDQATKDRLGAVLSVKGITAKEVSAAEAGKTNIVIGIAGSGGAAAAYAEENLEYDAALFEKVDAYLLAIEANQITIVGKDTDAAFYALASLKMILEQSEGTTVRQLQMEDYAVGQYRGFIEGYYGIPWSVDDRISLMQFGGDFKMNTYIFAPKDDPYHNSQWKELYPEEELADISRMVAAGTASKCRFVWAIHPFMHDKITSANYEESLEIVKNKFQQLYDAGVRQFVISADDATSEVTVQAKLCKDMSEWVKAHEGTYNLCFVPQVYCTASVTWSNWGGSTVKEYFDYFSEVTDVEYMWTGEWVCHPATQGTFDNFKEASGKEPFMWLNWPVNDVNHSRLVMGPAENCILNTGGVTGFKGIVTNPLEQAEASKTALFAIADYAWNTSDFDCEKSWADSFQYIDEGASDSLHELCKHLTNPSPGGITGMKESKEIQPFITEFQDAYQSGHDLTESGNALVAEFEKIIAAANDFQANGTNANLIDEMNPWVDSLRAISEAAVAYVKTAMALQAANDADAAKEYIKAVNAYEASKKCPAPQLGGSTINAQSGAMVLIPFVQAMNTAVKSSMEELLKHTFGGSTSPDQPVAEATVIYDGLGGFYEGSAGSIIDGDISTYAWFNQPQEAGAYVGLDLGDQYRINTVDIYQGNSDAHEDIFAEAIMEYSLDGENYTEIEKIANTNNISRDYTKEGILARYIRIRTASASNKWYAIREFSVTTSAPTFDVYTNADALKEMQASINQNEAHILAGDTGTDITLKAGEYIGLQLPAIREVTSVTADYTANSSLVLEASWDGIVWEEVSTGAQKTDCSIIRIRNQGTADAAFKLNTLSVENSERDARYVSTAEWEEGHDPSYAADNSLTTFFRAKEGSGAGSLTWRIANPVQIGSVRILAYPGSVEGAEVSVQTGEGEWLEGQALADGLNIYEDLEWYSCIKAVKVEWESKAPEIVEMYTTEPRIPGITLSATSVKLQLEKTFTLKAEVFTEQGEDRTVVWASDAPEVASVDGDGVVTANAVGVAKITASAAGGKYTAECVVVVSNRGDPEKLEIKAVEAGSEEIEQGSASEGPVSLAIDGDSSTYWHSLWAGDDLENLWISADLGEIKDVAHFTYLPRPSAGNGTILEYMLYVSQDGETWTAAAAGEWAADTTLKTAEIVTPVPARYVRLNAITFVSDSGKSLASAAEINVYGHEYDEASVDKRYVIDAGVTPVLDPDRYTEDSYAVYLDAKAKATEVMNNLVATQKEVDEASAAYKEALGKLVVKVSNIRLTPAEVTVKVGNTAEIKATVEPSDASDKTVTFTSDKPEIATVDANGVVTAKSEGRAVITASGANGVTATCTVEVVTFISVTGVKVSGTPSRAMDVGAQVTVTATVMPEDADNKAVTWTSSDPKVATVEDGVITAVGGGTAQITVTTEDGGFTKVFNVRVNAPAPVAVTGIELSGVPVTALEIGGKVTVTAAVQPENADNKNVLWKSSNPAVATVENGVVTAVAAGEAVISATTEDGGFEKSFTVKVNAPSNNNQGNNNNNNNNNDNNNNQQPAQVIPAAGKVYTISGAKYQVLTATADGGTVSYTGYNGNKKTNVKIPASVTIEGKPYKVTEIAKKALYKKTKLTGVTIGNNVTSIGASAFAGCTTLKKVTIGKGIKTIGASAFSGDKKLSKITVQSKNLTKVGKKALASVKKVTITVPKAKKKAYTSLFKGKGAKSVKVKGK